MEAFTEQLNIKMIMVSPTNHKSLLAEHGIKSLSTLLVKHLAEVWSWPDCLPYAMLCYNSYSTPNLDNMSPYELVFGHRATISQDLEIKPNVVVSGTFTDYYERLKKNLKYMRDRLCLGPIAWLMLGACSSHREAHARPCPSYIWHSPSTSTALHHCTARAQQ